MKILLVAYACEPNKGSEPEVGWQMVNEIAKLMPDDEVHVITKGNNEEIIKNHNYSKNIIFHYYSVPKMISFWKKGGRGIRTYYYVWMILATFFIAKKKMNFDIIHHITFVNDWMPSFFLFLKNKNNKFIWGPIGSNDYIDRKFLRLRRDYFSARISDIIKCFFRLADPFFYLCKIKSDCIIGINENVERKLKLNNKKFVAEAAIAINSSKENNKIDNGGVFKIIVVGRFVYIKNHSLSLYSFCLFIKKHQESNKDIKLIFIGSGTDYIYLRQLAEELKISNNVEFVGSVDYINVNKMYFDADVFLFPTLENAGFVTLEAMNYSLPVIALNYGGPKQFIKSNIDLQLVSPEGEYSDIAESIADKLNFFYLHKSEKESVGEQNRKDLLIYNTWNAKSKKIVGIYKELINED